MSNRNLQKENKKSSTEQSKARQWVTKGLQAAVTTWLRWVMQRSPREAGTITSHREQNSSCFFRGESMQSNLWRTSTRQVSSCGQPLIAEQMGKLVQNQAQAMTSPVRCRVHALSCSWEHWIFAHRRDFQSTQRWLECTAHVCSGNV